MGASEMDQELATQVHHADFVKQLRDSGDDGLIVRIQFQSVPQLAKFHLMFGIHNVEDYITLKRLHARAPQKTGKTAYALSFADSVPAPDYGDFFVKVLFHKRRCPSPGTRLRCRSRAAQARPSSACQGINAEKTLTHFQVLTDLIVAPEDSVPMRDRFRGLGYTLRMNGRDLAFEAIDDPYVIPSFGLAVFDVPVKAVFTPSVPSQNRPARYVFAEQAFGRPFGSLRWEANEPYHEASTGKSFRQHLSDQIDGDAMGASVANTGLGIACIGEKGPGESAL